MRERRANRGVFVVDIVGCGFLLLLESFVYFFFLQEVTNRIDDTVNEGVVFPHSISITVIDNSRRF